MHYPYLSKLCWNSIFFKNVIFAPVKKPLFLCIMTNGNRRSFNFMIQVFNNLHSNRTKGQTFREISNQPFYRQFSVAANDEKSLTPSNGVSKDMQVHCKLLYAFDVLKQGFGMSEDDIEDFFYSGRLRINKVRSGKRYAKIHPGDVVDLIKHVTDDKVAMKRIEILDVDKKAGKWKVDVRRWKHLVVDRIVE